MKFRKATKEQSWLRLALIGPSGSGKTYTAISIGAALGERLAVIDTERGSASKYAGDVADFEVLELDSFAPGTYVDALEVAAKEGFDVVVIDSLSHAWMGKEGALEQVDKAAARSDSKNSFAAWRKITPMHNALVDAILRYPGHVIITMRVKTEWVLEENARGKMEPVRKGLAPVQRDGLEYEFDVVGDMHADHTLTISKSRCSSLADAVIDKPGRKMAEALKAWLTTGSDPIVEAVRALEAASPETIEGAKDKARRAIKLATNGKRQALIDAVDAAEKRCAPKAAEAPASDAPPVPPTLAACVKLDEALGFLRANAERIRRSGARGRKTVDAEITRIVGDAPPPELEAVRKMVDDALGVKPPPKSDPVHDDDLGSDEYEDHDGTTGIEGGQ